MTIKYWLEWWFSQLSNQSIYLMVSPNMVLNGDLTNKLGGIWREFEKKPYLFREIIQQTNRCVPSHPYHPTFLMNLRLQGSMFCESLEAEFWNPFMALIENRWPQFLMDYHHFHWNKIELRWMIMSNFNGLSSCSH